VPKVVQLECCIKNFDSLLLVISMGICRGGQEGALSPPWLTKIVCMFFDFFERKYYVFRDF